MRVGLDITQAVKRKGRGIARYIEQVLPPMVANANALDLTLFIRGERWLRRSWVAGLTPGLQRKWLPFPVWMSGRGLDHFHSFGNHLPTISNVPLTFTIHDFRVLDRPSGSGNRLRKNIELADGILCLSEHGKGRLLHHYPDFDPRCIAVVPHGVDTSVFHPQDDRVVAQMAERYGLHAPFLIQLGSWFPHKNLELSIRAFARSRAFSEGYKLAFVGGGASRDFRAAMNALGHSEGVSSSVDWIENVPGADLPALLTSASCLLQPSRYEGFALPLLEAMAVGIPGVVSDSSCLPEVSGGIWPISGQDDPDAFAVGIDKMAFDTESRNIAIRAGLERAAGFTWTRTARMTTDFFQGLRRQ